MTTLIDVDWYRPIMDETRRIASLEAVSAETTVLFRVRAREAGGVGDESRHVGDDSLRVEPDDGSDDTGDDESNDVLEAIVLRDEEDDAVVAWLNYCQHLTHIPLDKGSGATMRDGEIICTNHGAYFESDTGLCTFGPCEGAYLTQVDVTATNGAVYLTDGAYEFVGLGGIETDDLDRTSTSNVEF